MDDWAPRRPADPVDCLVVGGGPAGLTAAIYLARFRLSVLVIDAGSSRAAMIPRTHNLAGYPGGIPGAELLNRMRKQAIDFGAIVIEGSVDCLTRRSELLLARVSGRSLCARSVLVATGVVNEAPDMASEIHDEGLARGLLRYCPICDGYEASDRRIGVIGTGTHGFNEAIFLRMYSRDITLIANEGRHSLSEEERSVLGGAGIVCRDGPCGALHIVGGRIVAPIPGENLTFECLYPALGSTINSGLALAMGAQATEEGCLVVDRHQRTSIAGLYAAGDVAKGLDQISHAMGEASVAATTIRNDLAKSRRLFR
ncbi:NAD(P)/FAD-dependent oxidoreductase (plasmid) [Novosphingobium sp. BL-8A]|uniref:NAD(P)/FAD-dependent oxidoreductase n=1 Tax=Novosphingobium sp. BL-8A TaxID=3127639 RepID=UPI00375634BC